MTKQLIKGYIFIIASAVIFGCMPLMTSFIYADGVEPLSLVFMRNCFSLPVLALLAITSGGSLRVPPRSLPAMAFVGVFGCALTPFLLFTSYTFMESGTATVFHFIYPAVVVILELISRKTRAWLGNMLSLGLCVAGIFMFYTPGGDLSLTGSVFALSSGITYAIYIFLLGIFAPKGMNGFTFSFYVTLCSTAALLIVCLVCGGVTLPTSAFGWFMSILFALSVNVGAVVLFQHGTFIVGGERAAILSTLEPITSIVVGSIALGDTIGPLTVIGSILVISASVLIAILDKKEGKGRRGTHPAS